MRAIFLHKDDELLFIKEQKSILFKLNGDSDQAVAHPIYPLYITLESEHLDVNLRLSELKAMLKKVSVESATLESSVISCPVKITLSDGTTIQEKLVLGKTFTPQNKELKGSLSKDLRVFRLADIKKTGPVTEVTNPVWCKIK